MVTRLLCTAIFLTFHPALWASDPKTANFEKACVTVKKKSGLCRCLSANIERKLATKDMNDEQLPLAIQAINGQPQDPEVNSTAYDNVADLLAGLEPHCRKNSNYSAE